MALNIVALNELLYKSSYSEEDIKKLLFSFETISSIAEPGVNDVEYFLHNRAIQYEKLSLSRTFLVMSTYQGNSFIAGYFSISQKPLVINKNNFNKLSNNLKKRLMGVGHRTEQKSYGIQGFLLGQIGRNFSEVATKAKSVSGDDLLFLAYKKIQEAHRLVGGRIVYLECEDIDKVKSFYKRNGFAEIEHFKSSNGMCIFVKKIEYLH